MLKVKFIGATKGVTGSCTWLWHTDSNTQFLVDCGMHQGRHEDEWLNYQKFEFDAAEIKYVLLTHAHIDHCGLLPKLVQNGFKGWVYCTRATKEIALLLLYDAAKISDYYTFEEIKAIKWNVIDEGEFHWNKCLRLANGLSATFKRNSHVLGSCAISVSWAHDATAGKEGLKSIYFSGDIGCQSEENPYLPLLKDDHYPYPKADYLVVESTYGSKVIDPKYKDAINRVDTLGDIITNTVFNKQGKVLIPAFSFHRTQELIMDIWWWQWARWKETKYADFLGDLLERDKDKGPKYENPLRVICDSPLGSRINKVYASQLLKKTANGKYQYLNNKLPGRLGIETEKIGEQFTRLVENGVTYHYGQILRVYKEQNKDTKTKLQLSRSESVAKSIDRTNVIIASSGMCDYGPVTEYLRQMRNDPKNTIIITGYQSPNSTGAGLLERAGEAGYTNMNHAEVVNMSGYYSAHADQERLLDYVFDLQNYYKNARSATVFINHGEASSKDELHNAIINRSARSIVTDRDVQKVEIARSEWFNLDQGCYIKAPQLSDASSESLLVSLGTKIDCLTREIEQLRKALPSAEALLE